MLRVSTPINLVFLSTLSLRRATHNGELQKTYPVDFYPRSPCGERQYQILDEISGATFLSTLSLRRATNQRKIDQKRSSISIHALLAESDKPTAARNNKNNVFLSTLSLRRATLTELLILLRAVISIHALLAESDRRNRKQRHPQTSFLSTLSLRRATPSLYQLYDTYAISIHALLAESDFQRAVNIQCPTAFLSTLSLRRATRRGVLCYLDNIDFYPRSPCGERRSAWVPEFPQLYISIHALLAESDASHLSKFNTP